MFKKFFDWLQKGNFVGEVEVLPRVNPDFTTNIPGVFVIGDLTGVPLLKFAVKNGKEVWKYIPDKKNHLYDAVIIGGGVSGISCAIEGSRLGKKILVLEAGEAFQTIRGFPAGKPIFAEPQDVSIPDSILIQDENKEELLSRLESILEKSNIPLQKNSRVNEILKSEEGFIVKTETGQNILANHVIIAIGKSGDPKKLNLLGENLPHVTHRLIDPADYAKENLVVVGGGDSAVEAAIATAGFAKSVTIVHRQKDFDRAKLENQEKLKELEQKGKLKILTNSNLVEIEKSFVLVQNNHRKEKIDTTKVLILVGSNPSLAFLNKIGIEIQNQKKFSDKIGLGALLGFATLVYAGKAAFYGSGWLHGLAVFASLFFVVCSLFWLYLKKELLASFFQFNWGGFKFIYLTGVSLFFLAIYFRSYFTEQLLFGKYPSFYYTFLYTMTILVFGIRRMYTKKTKYIYLQTTSLIFVQIFFLFLLPEIILPIIGKWNWLGPKMGFIRTEMFPKDAYWKAYGFILAWPLNLGILYDGQITNFWLVYSLLLTFGVIPILVYYFGKGAYCGWICSCGGLAETLGDEHRTKMPHGKLPNKIELSGQGVLLIAFILTFMKLSSIYFKETLSFFQIIETVADSLKWYYDLIVDIGLAGIVGVGFYFFYSGRVWCRMFCPLAALMHVYAKFSKFRIFADKKKCISCNVCTRNCHMGIDVMGYANKGIPMDNVQCVRCSACVVSCPTDVLEFGMVKK